MGEAGDEGPVIAILGEYDALPGLSQEAGVAEPRPQPGSCHLRSNIGPGPADSGRALPTARWRGSRRPALHPAKSGVCRGSRPIR